LFEAFFEFFDLDLRLPAISLQLIAVVVELLLCWGICWDA